MLLVEFRQTHDLLRSPADTPSADNKPQKSQRILPKKLGDRLRDMVRQEDSYYVHGKVLHVPDLREQDYERDVIKFWGCHQEVRKEIGRKSE